MTTQYNTVLTPEQEAQFLREYPDARDYYDYDMRGAWLAGAQKAGNGHLPDTYKKPNHPTFSRGSQYSDPKTPGGEWVQQGKKWRFVASPENLKYYTPDSLQSYFKTVEPDSELVLPPIVGPGAAFQGAIQ